MSDEGSVNTPWPALSAARLIRGGTDEWQCAFQEEDYSSGEGMQSAIFGPVFWTAIHLVSFNFPVQPSCADKERYKRWLLSTGEVLPCRYCRENFAKNMKDALHGRSLDEVLASRDAFSRFCHRLHQCVSLSLDEASPGGL